MSSASSAPADSMAVDSMALPPVTPMNIPPTLPSQLATQALPLLNWLDTMLFVEELVGGGKMSTVLTNALKALMTYWRVESWDDLAIFSSGDLADAITEASDIHKLNTLFVASTWVSYWIMPTLENCYSLVLSCMKS